MQRVYWIIGIATLFITLTVGGFFASDLTQWLGAQLTSDQSIVFTATKASCEQIIGQDCVLRGCATVAERIPEGIRCAVVVAGWTPSYKIFGIEPAATDDRPAASREPARESRSSDIPKITLRPVVTPEELPGEEPRPRFSITPLPTDLSVTASSLPTPEEDHDAVDELAAQSSVRGSFDRYREALGNGEVELYSSTLLNDSSQAMFSEVMAQASMMKAEYASMAGVPYQVKQQGNYAVVLFGESWPRTSPYFLSKSVGGWQIDLATMAEVIRYDQQNNWRLIDESHSYMYAF